MKKSAHKLSRRHAIDPWYSSAGVMPAVPPNALTGEAQPRQASWLYEPGGCEAYLLSRIKLEGFRDSLHVFHPGLFKKCSTTLSLCKTLPAHPAGSAASPSCTRGTCI